MGNECFSAYQAALYKPGLESYQEWKHRNTNEDLICELVVMSIFFGVEQFTYNCLEDLDILFSYRYFMFLLTVGEKS